MKRCWEVMADKLSKSRLELGLRRNRGLSGRTIFVADAHRGDGKRFVVRADEKLTAFLELERVTSDDDYRNQTVPKQLASVRGSRVQPAFLTEEQAIDYATHWSGSNTRIIVRHERDQEQYFAYATALRTASGPAYQIGPCRSRSLIRSKPSACLRGWIS